MTAKEPPNGWRFSPLGDLCCNKGEYGANVSKAPFDVRLPRYVRITDIGDNGLLRESDPASISEEAARGYLLEPGDVLLARSGATVGKSYVHQAYNGRCAYAGYLIRFRTRREMLIPEYAKHFLSSEPYWGWVRETQRAQAQPNINASEYASLSVPLPPLDEQRKIAAILSSLNDAIEATQAVIDQLYAVKKAMMAELLTRGLPGRHTRFKQTEIGDVPEEWKVRPLREVATIFNGKAAGTGGTWLRVFKTKHVYDGNVRLLKPEFARDDVAARVPESTFLRPDDVLTPNMAHGTIGRVAFVPCVDEKWTVDGQVMVIRADAVALSGRFVFEWLSLPQGRQRLLDLEKGGAFDTLRGQTHIYPKDVRELAVPVPPTDEQRAIGRCAASFDGPLADNASALEALAEIKQGLMQVLLTGELRVKPDEAAA